jgi:hypothetical protein
VGDVSSTATQVVKLGPSTQAKAIVFAMCLAAERCVVNALANFIDLFKNLKKNACTVIYFCDTFFN